MEDNRLHPKRIILSEHVRIPWAASFFGEICSSPDGWSEATITIDDGVIVHFADSIESVEDDHDLREGLIFPGMLDMHTHLGDHGARGDLPAGLREAVFPGGVKHRYLERCTSEDLVLSIERSLVEIHEGISFVMDYREGGLYGLSAMEDALQKDGPRVYSMGRPLKNEDQALLIKRSNGIGIPSLGDGLMDLRDLSRSSRKPFSIHTSELFREDIDSILELHPDQLVHMISGSRDDWRAVSGNKIPVVVCPRSNFAFDLDVPLYPMYKEEMILTLGTDNSMSSMHDLFREMELSWSLLRKGGLNGKEAAGIIFDMAVGATMKDTDLLGMLPDTIWWWKKDWPRVGQTPNFFVVKRPSDDLWRRDPMSFAVRFLDRSRVIYTGTL